MRTKHGPRTINSASLTKERETYMKRLLHATILAASLLAAATSFASGFALDETTASSVGNAQAGAAAVADDAGIAWHNPAGMTLVDAPTISLSAHGISPRANFNNGNSGAACVDPAVCRPFGSTEGPFSYTAWVPSVFVVLPIYRSLTFGLAVTAPYGLAQEYRSDWVGRYQAIRSEVETINVNPSFAFEINPKLSVGFGINYQTMNASLVNAVNPTASVGYAAAASGAVPLDQIPSLIGESLAMPDINQTLKGSGSAFGYNLGILLQVLPETHIGAAYRSAISYSLKGDVMFTVPRVTTATSSISDVISGLQQPGQFLASGPIHGSLKTPDSLNLSVAHRLTPNLQLLGDVSWTGWSSIPRLEFLRDDGSVLTSVEYKWKDTFRYSLGATYKVNSQLTLRGGLAYDETPMDMPHRTPYAPDGDRVIYAIGGRYSATPDVALDLGYTRSFLRDTRINNRSDDYPDFYGTLDGVYHSNISTLSIGVSYKFK